MLVDSITTVKEKLGDPIEETDLMEKKGDFKAHELRYAIKRVKREGGSIRDQEIFLYFDLEGRLFEIGYSAMDPVAGEVIYSYVESQTGTE